MPSRDTKSISSALQSYVVWQNFVLSFLHLHSSTETLHSGISHSSCRLPQTNWQMVALWQGYCFWHYVKRVALDRVNHPKARGGAQLCAVKVSFCLGKESEFISYSLVSISRPQPMALYLSHDWHTQCDSPELGEGMLFLLRIHTGILHFLSIKARQCWWIFIWCIPSGRREKKKKKDALLCVNVSCSRSARGEVEWIWSSSRGWEMYCTAVALHLLCFGIASVKSELLSGKEWMCSGHALGHILHM